ncbi:MGH1-like glycoside hydrolase domain-containing protein [Paenibacillus barengoltzii]|uniref:MGH1-like glycoside hydrolase domain-containing protein n=1 Tax=Paenibacillus barengoltzii TaxID=343517 RepID=UPI00398ADB20
MGEMGEMGVLERLRKMEVVSAVGGEGLRKSTDQAVLEEFAASGVKFAANEGSPLERVYYAGVRKLLDCIVPSVSGVPVLHEGGVYLGTWLESTGTINTELLSRFVPSVAQATFALFAEYQRADGLMPYKVTGTGPVYRQIQMVTPLARSVWNHYRLNGRADRKFLDKMYRAMERHDAWLSAFRDTRGTGCVEAFCTFDTGHDLSPRFWHVPDTPHLGDPRQYDPDSAVLPLLAPDLTANVYCQRRYLGDIAAELGIAAGPEWTTKAEASLSSLMKYCYDAEDGFFYDVDASGQFVRIQSDVLLRVLACEVGDGEFFASSLRRYLLNTRKFFAKYPFTSIALDDPRFDPSSAYNTWAGTTNFLSLIRAPHAFEYHDRHVELTWVLQPILSAMVRMERFAQCLSPWTGEEGFTETYSPAILCLLDYVERLCGILPTPEEELWFTGLLPYAMDHGEVPAEETAYARTVDGMKFELVNTREGSIVYRNGEPSCRFPYGTRLVTDRRGEPRALIGMSVRSVEGLLEFGGRAYPVNLSGNEVWRINHDHSASSSGSGLIATSTGNLAGPGVVLPTYY